MPSPRAAHLARPALLIGALTISFALTGCAQVSDIVEQILPERTGAHTLVVGECFNDTVRLVTEEEAVMDVPRENCTLDHDNEVIASIQLEGAEFPGDDAVTTQGSEDCLPEFEEFIGVGLDEAGTLEYDFFVPSAASWELGDREILCFTYDSAAQSAYSLRGKGAEQAAVVDAGGGEADS